LITIIIFAEQYFERVKTIL